ncbi:MAG: hypothetical protein M1837_004638 [Sclerophora amabilis]|nr:MAG: hypothetical protein M1837_004638 [Sclerophora amabilis]
MAPLDTPRRKNREANYFEVGVKGRKTGITLKEAARDEHGLEVIDGIFSSPAKSPVKANGATARDERFRGDTSLHESSTIIPSGSRSTRSNRAQFPPPKARSPIKTNLNSPARKRSSVGPAPSSTSRNPDTPSRAASHPFLQRQRDLSSDRPIPSVEHITSSGKRTIRRSEDSPSTFRSRGPERRQSSTEPEEKPVPQALLPKGRKRGLLQTRPQETFEHEFEQSLNDVVMPEEDDDDDRKVFSGGMIDRGDGSLLPLNEGDLELQSQLQDSIRELDQSEVEPDMSERGGKRKQAGIARETVSPVPTSSAPKRGRGRPPKSSKRVDHDQIQQGEEELDEAGPPLKRAKNSRTEKYPFNQRKGNVTKPPPSLRSPHAKITSAKRGRRRASQEIGTETETAITGRSRKARDSSLGVSSQVQSNWQPRHQTPIEDEGVQTTRSGRPSLKPLAYWRNERIVYGGGNKARGTLPAIQEVIRTEEVEAPKRPSRRPTASKKRSRAASVAVEEQLEPWEISPGVIMTEVSQWDPDQGLGLKNELIESDIAFSSTAIETREVANSTFRYAKTLTTPFFGAGLVDVPPGGIKRPKNSRKMQLVFFVFYGRVLVDVAGTPFRISKGGMWQVPRG